MAKTTRRGRAPRSTGRESADDPIELPTAEELDRLQISPEVAWYLLDRGHGLPDCPPAIKTPEPREAPGAVFDPAKVDAVLRAFGSLRHTQGEWAGRPLTPDCWQVAYVLAPVFGWVCWDVESASYTRIIRDCYIDVPRKNGKSTLGGGIAIYLACADGEPAAQVLCAATVRDQAEFVFSPIKTLADKSPALKPFVRALKHAVIHKPSLSYIKVIANSADAQHGGNIHGSIIDELHLHKHPDLVEALETGTGSRRQPLSVKITTADAGKPGTIYARKRLYLEQLSKRVFTDHTTYGVVFAADPGDDPFAEATQRKANPGYGVSPKRAYLRSRALQAQSSPAELASYQRLHLGIRTRQLTRYYDLGAWDRNASIVDEDALSGRRCYGGIDLASTSDLCALAWLFPDRERGGFDVLYRVWTPEANVAALDKRTANEASVWVRRGLLRTTPGNVVDYAFMLRDIKADLGRFKVKGVGYDRWNATQIITDLYGEGAPMVKVGQGFASMSAPSKELQRLMLTGNEEHPLIRHGGNPIGRWCVDNVAMAIDAAENVKPDKENSADKIDTTVATIDALAVALADMAAEPGEPRIRMVGA